MTNKQKVKNQKQRKARAPKPQPKTPFRDVGGIVGNAISKYTGFSGAGGIGKWLGTGIGSIFGSGDYQMVGQEPDYNVLTSSKQIPKFSTTHASNVVCHREYLGDIQGTAGFNNTAYPINPGMSKTFPWLSVVAQNYQEYKIHGLIFEFRPLITDFVSSGAPGVVIMATNYNADASPYTTKQAMENTEFAVSVKPTMPLIHAVECNPHENPFAVQYVRTGSLPTGTDLKAYDLGAFQFATQSNPTQNLGELWVSYCVEFLKPTLPLDIGGNVQSAHGYRNAVSGANPYGLVQLYVKGTLNLVFNSSSNFSFDGTPGQYYMITMSWRQGTAVASNVSGVTFNNAVAQLAFNGPSSTAAVQPDTGLVSTGAMQIYIILCTALVPSPISGVMGVGGTLPTNCGFDLYITEVGAGQL